MPRKAITLDRGYEYPEARYSRVPQRPR
jgi:hypothetical protein